MKTVTKTVKEIFEALEKNGFEHLRGQWTNYMGSAACILGQAALNLSVVGTTERDSLWGDLSEEEPLLTIENRLNLFLVPKDSLWYRSSNAHRCGDAIMYWNDKYDDAGLLDHHELKTYEEVVAMAKDILEPYFAESVELTVYEHEFKQVSAV